MTKIVNIEVNDVDDVEFINKDSKDKIIDRLSNKLIDLDMMFMAYFGKKIKAIELES